MVRCAWFDYSSELLLLISVIYKRCVNEVLVPKHADILHEWAWHLANVIDGICDSILYSFAYSRICLCKEFVEAVCWV